MLKEPNTSSKNKKVILGFTSVALLFILATGFAANPQTMGNPDVYQYPLYLIPAMIVLLILLAFRYYQFQQHQKSLKKLQQTEEQLHWALWGSGDGLWDWDIQSGQVYRRGIPEMLGYHQDEFNSSTAQLVELMHPEDSNKVIEEVEKHLVGQTSHFEAEYRVLSKSGQWLWILDKGKVVARDGTGKPTRAAGTQADITARKQSERELSLAAEVIQSMNEIVIITNEQLQIELVNHAFHRLMGSDEKEIIGQPLHHFFSDRHDRQFYKSIMRSLQTKQYWRGELWQTNAKQQEILTSMEIKQVAQSKDNAPYFVAIFSDITEKKRSQDKLIYLANFDTLTGLPNRALFHERLTASIQNAKETGRRFCVMNIDIDHFKHVNESLGHTIGDQLLQRVALNLKEEIPVSHCTMARLAGDEFTLLLPDLVDKQSLIDFANQILKRFEQPILIENHTMSVSPSIGICRYPEDGNDTLSLLRNVQNALQFAKTKGRRNYQFYDQDIQSATLRKLILGNHLRLALDKKELEVVYQPKFDLKSRRLVGMEALLRWHSADVGAIEPSEFIGIAEETGIVNDIGLWVLQEACKQARQWQFRGRQVPISVNISARQFQQHGLYKIIANVLTEVELTPDLLELEITETMLLDDPDSAITTLLQLKEMGVKIAVDDFGTGYSSLSYLKNLPIDTLKIDKAFIQDIAQDKDDEAITRAIISLAQNLSLNVIAEGVETEAQLGFLQEAGCAQVQGYLLSPPMTAEESTVFCDDLEQEHVH